MLNMIKKVSHWSEFYQKKEIKRDQYVTQRSFEQIFEEKVVYWYDMMRNAN